MSIIFIQDAKQNKFSN